jgi:hypothetical protein
VSRPERLRITIQVAAPAGIVALQLAWLGGWAVGEVTILELLLTGRAGFFAPFVKLFLVGWTCMGALAALAVAWSRSGRVELTVEGQVLTIRRAIGERGLERTFDLDKVEALRSERAEITSVDFGPSRTSDRWFSIAFNHGWRVHRLPVNLEVADRDAVLSALQDRVPRLVQRLS